MNRWTRTTTVTGVAASLALTSFAPAVGTALAAPSSSGTTSSVIVLLRDQLRQLPADRAHVSERRAAALSQQNAVLSRLAGRPSSVVHYTAANAVSLKVTAAQAAALAADPSVATVLPDTQIAIARRPSTADASAAPASATTAQSAPLGTPPSTNVCPSDPSKPLLEPEALEDTHDASDDPNATTAQQLTDGSGVTVAYIADAIDPDNPDFIRSDGSHVIVDYKAFSPDGPTPGAGGAEAYGDASSIAAQGLVTHDLSTFVNPAHPLPPGCNIRILGMAPGASIVALKSDLYTTSIVQAIDYAVSVDHVNVLNESFGGAPIPDASARSAISAFNDAAVAAGTTVTVSSGDAGTTGTIGNPATDPQVISVAGNTNSRAYLQTAYAGASQFGNGKWVNDEISSLSSGGFTQSGGTVDLTAPGESGWAACDAGSFECTNFHGGHSDFQLFGGTSQSAPLVAGAAALVISAYRSTHGGASPSPAVVKALLTGTATDLGLPTFEQGAGLLNARAAVEAALTYPGATAVAPAGVGANVVLPGGQTTLSGAPGATKTVSLPVQNVGTSPVTVTTKGRDYATIGVDQQSTSIDHAAGPTFAYATTGAPWAYKRVTFTVADGVDRLALQAAWQGGSRVLGDITTPVVRFSLFDPTGTYVANSRPQGGAVSANYANLDVRAPVSGLWTALLYTPVNGGYTGDVTLRFTSQHAVAVGKISQPTLTIAPGQTGYVTAKFVVPSGGDTSYALVVSTPNGQSTAVPVTVRTIVPITNGRGSFTGTITGGNARGGEPAQTFAYAFDVPSGLRDLNVGVTLADDPRYLLEGVLVDPNGETQAIDSNYISSDFVTLSDIGNTLQMTTATPMPGRWRAILVVANPVPGAAITEAFAGSIRFNQVRATATGLPTSPNVTLRAGTTRTAQVTVTNTGIAPINVQIDPRAKTASSMELVSPFGPQEFSLPSHAAPTFLVPPGTTGLTATSTSAVPALVDLLDGTQGIDVVGDLASSAGGTTSTASVNDAPSTVSTGVWFTDVEEFGAFDGAGAPSADAAVSLHATTPAFDPWVTSSTGDFWAASLDPDADLGQAVTIAPGASATISVTIAPPAGTPSKAIQGVLYVYTTPSFAYPTFNTTGDVLAKIPYAYTVK